MSPHCLAAPDDAKPSTGLGACRGPADTTPVSAGPAALPDAAWTPPASTANGGTRP